MTVLVSLVDPFPEGAGLNKHLDGGPRGELWGGHEALGTGLTKRAAEAAAAQELLGVLRGVGFQ